MGSARVFREFDLTRLTFVEDGFNLPESKGNVAWIDRDNVYVGTDFGEGSMTRSGYPRTIRRWARGTELSESEIVFEGECDDVTVYADHNPMADGGRSHLCRCITMVEAEDYVMGTDGTLKRICTPRTATNTFFGNYLLVSLRENWSVGEVTYSEGSLLVTKLESAFSEGQHFDVLFEPTEKTSLTDVVCTRDHVLVSALHHVRTEIFRFTPGEDGWSRQAVEGIPPMGTATVFPVDKFGSNSFFLEKVSFIRPSSLFLFGPEGVPELIKAMPNLFSPDGLKEEQRFAQSDDGTMVPYFVIFRDSLKHDGTAPTIITGYGGFEVPVTPAYLLTRGPAWLQKGGVFVVANIRGGGEYGPRWHRAALREKRHKAYEDFAAVARDLCRERITSPERMGALGRSNGGLLVGNMYTRYPDLFRAIVCQVPLLDMKRYHKLLAGASWMCEYGDPDKPEEWETIKTFSPYHNVRPNGSYPAILLATSTRDDRVHPGHARKMKALLDEYGHSAWYYENTEGGHQGASDNRQAAHLMALVYTFLAGELGLSCRPQ